MTRTDTPPGGAPEQLAIERALVGAALLSPDGVLADTSDVIVPGDFYHPRYREAWTAICELHREGVRPDVQLVADRTGPEIDLPWLVETQAASPVARSARSYAARVVQWSLARAALAVVDDAAGQLRRGDGDPADVALRTAATLESIGREAPGVGPPAGLVRLADLAADDRPLSRWVIPGLLRADTRLMLVAEEGAGKTVLLRQLAICAAAGVHPLARTSTEPARVLIVDLENPTDSVLEVCRPILAETDRIAGPHWDRDRLWIWHHQQGVDVRQRSGRAQLEAAVEAAQPQLVVLGPLYKLWRSRPGEGWDQPALEVQSVLDDLRTRFGFALVIEHHAPQGDGKSRAIRPEGSGVWRRWPDLRFALEADSGKGVEPGTYRLVRWGGDRIRSAWPRRLVRELRAMGDEQHSGRFPWQAPDRLASIESAGEPVLF